MTRAERFRARGGDEGAARLPTADPATRRASDLLWLAATTALAGVFVLKLVLGMGVVDPGRWTSTGIATAAVGFHSENRAVGEGYYAELGKAFLQGQTYFDRELHPDLRTHPNPWGSDAFRRGIILMDASYFGGRYYLYFGPSPVIAVYLPFLLVTSHFPSDALVVTALGLFYAMSVALLLRAVLPRRRWEFLPLFCLAVANPPLIKSLATVQNVHGVSRAFAGASLVVAAAAALALVRGVRESAPGGVGPVLLPAAAAGSFVALAASARLSALPDAVGIVAFGAIAILAARRGVDRVGFRSMTALAAPLVLTLAALAAYNFARFGSPFETGLRFQTNGLDFVHGEPLVRPPRDAVAFVLNLGYRAYEYFGALPEFEAGGRLRVTYATRSPFVSGAYSEGAIGLLAWAPIVLYVPIVAGVTFARGLRSGVHRLELAFLALASLAFATNFVVVSSMPITAFHYLLELLPRLAWVVVATLAVDPDAFAFGRERPVRSVALGLTAALCAGGLLADHLA